MSKKNSETVEVDDIPVETDSLAKEGPKELLVETCVFVTWETPVYEFCSLRKALAMDLDTSKAVVVRWTPEFIKKLQNQRYVAEAHSDFLAGVYSKGLK
jgi:hypothetical protein